MGIPCAKKVCEVCESCEHCLKNMGSTTSNSNITIGSLEYKRCCKRCLSNFKDDSFKNHDNLMQQIDDAIKERDHNRDYKCSEDRRSTNPVSAD